jgi:hypothetical protein
MFHIDGKEVTGTQAELHYMNWCLALEQEHSDVPHTALDAMADFQKGAFGGCGFAKDRMYLAGIEVR